jgi:hypothetical protein
VLVSGTFPTRPVGPVAIGDAEAVEGDEIAMGADFDGADVICVGVPLTDAAGVGDAVLVAAGGVAESVGVPLGSTATGDPGRRPVAASATTLSAPRATSASGTAQSGRPARSGRRQRGQNPETETVS